jgi:hypothetical protein
MEKARLQKIWSKVLNQRMIIEGHWLHQNKPNAEGYATTSDGRLDRFKLHRIALSITHDLDYDGDWFACHKVECGVRGCWNPDHLYIGNQSTNALDRIEEGKHNNARKLACIKGHEFTQENLIPRANGKRDCRECARERDRRKYQEQKNANKT